MRNRRKVKACGGFAMFFRVIDAIISAGLLGQFFQFLKECQILLVDFQIGAIAPAVRFGDRKLQNGSLPNAVLHDRIQKQGKLGVCGPKTVPGGFHF